MKQMILEITAGAEFDGMPEELQAAIQKAKVEWPESRLLGTKEINGKQLILIMCGLDSDTLERWMNTEYPSGVLDENHQEVKMGFNLGWKVLAEEGVVIDQSLLLPYFEEIPAYNNEGDFIGTEAVTDLTGKLQTWAGHLWTF